LFSVDVVQSVPQRLSSEYSTSARGANSMSDYSGKFCILFDYITFKLTSLI